MWDFLSFHVTCFPNCLSRFFVSFRKPVRLHSYSQTHTHTDTKKKKKNLNLWRMTPMFLNYVHRISIPRRSYMPVLAPRIACERNQFPQDSFRNARISNMRKATDAWLSQAVKESYIKCDIPFFIYIYIYIYIHTYIYTHTYMIAAKNRQAKRLCSSKTLTLCTHNGAQMARFSSLCRKLYCTVARELQSLELCTQ